MEEKKSVKLSYSVFFLIIAIIIIGIMGYLIYKLNDDKRKSILEINSLNNKIDSLEKSVASMKNQINNASKTNNTNESNNLSNNTEAVQNIQNSIEDTIKELFLKELKERDNNNDSEKLIDYRVDKITLLKYTDMSEDFQKSYKPTDILAEVTYSVKPNDINRTAWLAGNGVTEGEWIVNKTACTYLRDGKLLGGLSTGW